MRFWPPEKFQGEIVSLDRLGPPSSRAGADDADG